MSKIIFVTGFHRAGTRAFAKHLARENNIMFGLEPLVSFNNMEKVRKLIKEHSKGFILQCPFLAHKVLELKDMGEVYWCTRDVEQLITSMRNLKFDINSFAICKDFKNEFPDDPIWDQITYSGKKDIHYGWINHYKKMLELKEYFYETKFKNYVEVRKLEDAPWYDESITESKKKPLREPDKKYYARLRSS
jgi:hypothetical protein